MTNVWIDHEGKRIDPPAVTELPWLPEAWIDGLRSTPQTTGDDFGLYDVNQAFTEGDSHKRVTHELAAALEGLRPPARSWSKRLHGTRLTHTPSEHPTVVSQ